MTDIFTFDNVADLADYKIKRIVEDVDFSDLSKALISEGKEIRKKFYSNMDLSDLQKLNDDMMDTGRFSADEKRESQEKILTIISKIPEYRDMRFSYGFASLEKFESFLLERAPPKQQYGLFDKEITMCHFFDTKNGDEILADIVRKNEEQGMGNVQIPNTNITLINYSICPKCNHVYSYKDLADYYANPRPNPVYKNSAAQYREDTRMYCHECGTYFLPALVISDGTPQNEVQFLCRIQTMDAIEAFYLSRGRKVLSANRKNIVYASSTKNSVHHIPKALRDKRSGAKGRTFKQPPSAIRNDVLLKEMEEKPTLISNLLQYTPAGLAINLIDGSNARKGDVLFGSWR